MLSAIKVSANTNLLFDQVSTFVEKILRIQKAYRKYSIKKEFKMRLLRISWNKFIEKSLFTKRSNSIRRKESIKYVSIPNGIRDRILKEYYYNCLRTFQKEMRKYLNLKKKSKSIKDLSIRPPDFKCMPSDLMMENMIKTSLKR